MWTFSYFCFFCTFNPLYFASSYKVLCWLWPQFLFTFLFGKKSSVFFFFYFIMLLKQCTWFSSQRSSSSSSQIKFKKKPENGKKKMQLLVFSLFLFFAPSIVIHARSFISIFSFIFCMIYFEALECISIFRKNAMPVRFVLIMNLWIFGFFSLSFLSFLLQNANGSCCGQKY